ncbi:MAG TPA: GNAT family N-acetyltransferase [Candidatus Eisenbacteria bacterium]|nr:GNAT family N-acetyltransferase [Candidatus Eisenbacteria bacterium]
MTRFELPAPYRVVGDPREAACWWPPHPADPRDGLPWARGSRRSAGERFVGTDGGPALWLRPVVHGDGSPARMNAVDVCAGLVSEVPAPELLVAEARAGCPCQVVVAANGYGSPRIEARDASRAERLDLLAAVVEAARRAGAVPAVLHCPAGDPLLELLPDLDFAVGVTDLYPTLELPGDSIEHYLAALPHRRRIDARREMRQLAAGGSARVYAGRGAAAHLGVAAELVSLAYANRGQHAEPAEVCGIYTRLLEACQDDFVLCVVEAGGAAVSSACLVQGATDLLLYSAGIRLPQSREVAGYFNAAYYVPIAFAYERGLRRMRLGPSGVRTKRYRGARFVPLHSAVPRSCAPLAALLRATDEHVRRELAGLAGGA